MGFAGTRAKLQVQSIWQDTRCRLPAACRNIHKVLFSYYHASEHDRTDTSNIGIETEIWRGRLQQDHCCATEMASRCLGKRHSDILRVQCAAHICRISVVERQVHRFGRCNSNLLTENPLFQSFGAALSRSFSILKFL